MYNSHIRDEQVCLVCDQILSTSSDDTVVCRNSQVSTSKYPTSLVSLLQTPKAKVSKVYSIHTYAVGPRHTCNTSMQHLSARSAHTHTHTNKDFLFYCCLALTSCNVSVEYVCRDFLAPPIAFRITCSNVVKYCVSVLQLTRHSAAWQNSYFIQHRRFLCDFFASFVAQQNTYFYI